MGAERKRLPFPEANWRKTHRIQGEKLQKTLIGRNSPSYAGVSWLITVYWQVSESRTLCCIRLKES